MEAVAPTLIRVFRSSLLKSLKKKSLEVLSMNYVGIDIHKVNCEICVVDEAGVVVRRGRVPTDVVSVLQFFDYLSGQVRVVVEACGIRDDVIDALRVRGFDVVVSNPLHNRLIAEGKVKTDRRDARILAELLRVNALKTVYIPSKDIRVLRDGLRQRNFLVRQRAAVKNRLKRYLLRYGVNVPRSDPTSKFGRLCLEKCFPNDFVIISLLSQLDSANTAVDFAEAQLKPLTNGIPEIAKLDLIPGIGWLSAAVIWAEIASINRFSSARHLVGYAGLYPSVSQSGETCRRGHMPRGSDALLRTTLVQCTQSLILKDNRLSRFFTQLAKRKPRNVALAATARKLLEAIYYVIKYEKPFIS